MYPTLLTLGSWEIRSYPAALVTAILLGVFVCWRESERVGSDGNRVLLFCVGAIPIGLLGARLNDWLFHLETHRLPPGSGLLSNSGAASFGGLIGVLVYALAYARISKWSPWGFLDLLAPIVPLLDAIVRCGCLLNGCCYGRETSGFLGLYLPDASGRWLYRYPTQLLLIVFNLALFAWLWRRRRAPLAEGDLLLSYLALYHVGRVAIDGLRGDQQAVVGSLTTHQLTAALIALGACAALLLRARAARKNHEDSS